MIKVADVNDKAPIFVDNSQIHSSFPFIFPLIDDKMVIKVADVNDEAPIFVDDGVFSVSKDPKQNELVGIVKVDDPDG